jgi:hypothetical protein
LESPISFVNAMEGAALAAKRKQEADLSLAWHVEAFARQKKLKKLSEILGHKPKAQTTDEMLAELQAFASRGIPMNIKKLH